ncbi:hypothetical protein H6G76_21365 [Nostoc sp. FACHB-152]|uniref:hypothetical protein n=1 Tax=unclassified Nostoc TaxID=2593658 RepID=UPI0016857746|nr:MULTISPECIES: hypothetical protein [unclassified Nostoc]MBD2449670.1 hypothetical protein [Nostoc sp. FACHB-152]MBD2469666.1 hypothetical protein [Nostoc sp. FACHB-145]
MNNQLEQLLTELTPEQAATLEGGLFLLVDGFQAINAGADTFNGDDTYITVNGQRLAGAYDGVSTGQFIAVNRGLGVSDFANVDLFDEDDGFLSGSDDYLGGFTVTGVTNGQAVTRVSGGGSTYDVYYRAF